jgi:hypothetical protein
MDRVQAGNGCKSRLALELELYSALVALSGHFSGQDTCNNAFLRRNGEKNRLKQFLLDCA